MNIFGIYKMDFMSAGIRINFNDKVIFIDPLLIDDNKKADYIFISHNHLDHFSKKDIKKLTKQETIIIGPETVAKKLKNNKDHRSYYYRWEHFFDLCGMATENYDFELAKRFVETRKKGVELLEILQKETDGIRHNDLAQRLEISPPYLSKLLRQFEQHNLVTRERRSKFSLVRLGLAGRAYMADKGLAVPAGIETPLEFETGYRINSETAGLVMDRHPGDAGGENK